MQRSVGRNDVLEGTLSCSVPRISYSVYDSYPDQIPHLKPRRIVLTKEHALEIYKLKMSETLSTNAHKPSQSPSRLVAKSYGVSPKTIRDIWNRKTWASVTQHLSHGALDENAGSLPPLTSSEVCVCL